MHGTCYKIYLQTLKGYNGTALIMPYSVRQFATVNFLICIGVMFAWLLFSTFHVPSLTKEFLGFQARIRAPVWIWIVLEPILLAGYLSDRADLNRWSRLMIGLFGLIGLALSQIIPLFGDIAYRFTVERFIALYVWGSHLVFAIVWRQIKTY